MSVAFGGLPTGVHRQNTDSQHDSYDAIDPRPMRRRADIAPGTRVVLASGRAGTLLAVNTRAVV